MKSTCWESVCVLYSTALPNPSTCAHRWHRDGIKEGRLLCQSFRSQFQRPGDSVQDWGTSRVMSKGKPRPLPTQGSRINVQLAWTSFALVGVWRLNEPRDLRWRWFRNWRYSGAADPTVGGSMGWMGQRSPDLVCRLCGVILAKSAGVLRIPASFREQETFAFPPKRKWLTKFVLIFVRPGISCSS